MLLRFWNLAGFGLQASWSWICNETSFEMYFCVFCRTYKNTNHIHRKKREFLRSQQRRNDTNTVWSFFPLSFLALSWSKDWAGKISSFQLPFIAPTVMVKKKTNSITLCFHLFYSRRLNRLTLNYLGRLYVVISKAVWSSKLFLCF